MHTVGQALFPHYLPQASHQFCEVGVISTPTVDDVETYIGVCPETALLVRGRQSWDLKTPGSMFCGGRHCFGGHHPCDKNLGFAAIVLFVVPKVYVLSG